MDEISQRQTADIYPSNISYLTPDAQKMAKKILQKCQTTHLLRGNTPKNIPVFISYVAS